MSTQTVLLVENHPSLAHATARLLRAKGLEVINAFGVRGLPPEPSKLLAMQADRTTDFEVDVVALGLKIALVDYDLGNGSLTGDKVIPRLLQLGVFCLGIGDREGGQFALLKAGANLTLRNKVNLSSAVLGELNAKDYRWPQEFDVEANGADILARMAQLLAPSSREPEGAA